MMWPQKNVSLPPEANVVPDLDPHSQEFEVGEFCFHSFSSCVEFICVFWCPTSCLAPLLIKDDAALLCPSKAAAPPVDCKDSSAVFVLYICSLSHFRHWWCPHYPSIHRWLLHPKLSGRESSLSKKPQTSLSSAMLANSHWGTPGRSQASEDI